MPTFIRFLVLVGLSFAVPVAQADIPSALEPGYADAVLAYNSKEYPKAVTMLNALIAKDGNVVEFKELKALTLKTMKDPAAVDAYMALIEIKTKEGKPEKEIAAYHFELGQIYMDKGDLAKSEEEFKISMNAGFNVYPSHFFTGLVHYKAKAWDKSDAQFQEVLRGDVEDLKPSAHFYVGQIALQTGYAPGATQSFYAARNVAQEQMNAKDTVAETRKMAKQVFEQADASLKPFNTSKFFGNVTLISGYDSNVLSVPGSESSTGTGTGKASVKETLQAGLGWMTSPLNYWQWVPSYQGSFNYNFNQDLRNGQFMSHNLSIYATRGALNATSWGLKFAGTYTMQDQVDPDTDKGTFHPYSLVGVFGPYVRKDIGNKVTIGGEATVQPGKNYLDSSVPETYKRTGIEYVVKTFIKQERGSKWFNPGGSVGFDFNNTNGDEYNSKAFTLGVVNAMRFTDATTVTLAVDFSPVSYSKRAGESRSDKYLSFDTSLSQKLTEKASLVADMQFISNSSNITDVYQYARLVVSAGLGYSL